MRSRSMRSSRSIWEVVLKVVLNQPAVRIGQQPCSLNFNPARPIAKVERGKLRLQTVPFGVLVPRDLTTGSL